MKADDIQVRSSPLGVIVIQPSGVEADPRARRLLDWQDSEGPAPPLLEEICSWVAATDTATLPQARAMEATVDGAEARLVLEARLAGESVVVLIRQLSSEDQREGAGALAIALDSVHRQTTHEFRGLLNSISLNITLLGRAARGDLANLSNARERQQEWVKAVEEQLQRLTELIDKWSPVLFVSADDPAVVDLRKVLGDLDFLLSPIARSKKLELEIRYPETGVPIEAPRQELLRLLASWTVITVGPLEEGDRWILDLSESEGEALLVATGNDDEDDEDEGVGDDESEGQGGEEDRGESETDGGAEAAARPARKRLAEALEASSEVYERLFASMGGDLEVDSDGGWRLRWPLLDETEEDR